MVHIITISTENIRLCITALKEHSDKLSVKKSVSKKEAAEIKKQIDAINHQIKFFERVNF